MTLAHTVTTYVEMLEEVVRDTLVVDELVGAIEDGEEVVYVEEAVVVHVELSVDQQSPIQGGLCVALRSYKQSYLVESVVVIESVVEVVAAPVVVQLELVSLVVVRLEVSAVEVNASVVLELL